MPVYFLHGDVNGGGFFCRILAQLLGCPFFAVHPHGLDGGRVPATIESMARDRLESLQTPCHLVGYCSGGLVAFEIARQMSQRGQPVGRVILLEVPPQPPPVPGPRSAILIIRCWPRFTEAVRRFPSWRRAEACGEVPAVERQRSGPEPGSGRRWPPGALRTVTTSACFRPHADAMRRRYRPQPYNGPIVLLRANSRGGPARSIGRAGWGKACHRAWRCGTSRAITTPA